MARFGHAGTVVAQNAIGMAALGGGVMSIAMGIGAALDAATNTLRVCRYEMSLGQAFQHADEMTGIASAAVQYAAELEQEVAQLRAACQQRQEVIEMLKVRA